MLSGFQGLRGCELYVRAVQTGHAITMQEFTADLKHRIILGLPPLFSRNERMPTIVPRYLHLDLSKHVMRNVSRFRLRAHALKVEAAA